MENIFSRRIGDKKALRIVLLLSCFYFVVQLVVGFRIGSLAVISDAGHMLIDVVGLVMALLAISFAQKPATPARTYGFFRAEILASLLNSIFLILLSVFIIYEAAQRIFSPPEVGGLPIVIVASVGLGINILGVRLLSKVRLKNHTSGKSEQRSDSRREENLNIHGAYLEVLADTIGSVGVIVAGIIILTTRFYLADPIISIGIVVLILPRTWLLLRRAIHILIEGTPSHLHHEEIKDSIMSVKGVTGVFDLHIWTITSGIHALSAHVVIIDHSKSLSILKEISSLLENKFGINHSTIQIESYHQSGNI